MGASLLVSPASAVDGIINEDNLKGIEYREVGPFRGGRVTTVVGVVGDNQTYYMGSMGGVWKTVNAGNTWENVSDGHFGTASVGSVVDSTPVARLVHVGCPWLSVASCETFVCRGGLRCKC